MLKMTTTTTSPSKAGKLNHGKVQNTFNNNAYIPTDFSLRCDDGHTSSDSTSSSSVPLDDAEVEQTIESAAS
jgi:hypothetical protein